jgi:hypothetical protein
MFTRTIITIMRGIKKLRGSGLLNELGNCSCILFYTNFKYLQIMVKLYSNTLSSSYNEINTQYQTVGTIPWSNIKLAEIGKIDSTQLHDRSLSCHVTGTSIKCSSVNQCYGPKLTLSMTWCDHASAFNISVKCQKSHKTALL